MQTKIDLQTAFSSILKRKAVGPSGSRHLNEDDLSVIFPALNFEEISLASKAVLVTAVVILERNELEDKLLKNWKSGERFLPAKLKTVFFEKNSITFDAILQKILKNEDLNTHEASAGISYLLDDKVPSYKKGIFLIGERLKRETFEENEAFLQRMRQAAHSYSVDVPFLIDLSDPYDGFCRYPIYTPFVAALLSAMGFPAYCHGTKTVAPKNGDTIHKILALAGKNPLKSPEAVIKDIENQEIGWGYIDQSIYFPSLYKLTKLRENIVKRPFLATLEKLLQPLRSVKSNCMVTGFVHSAYKKKLAGLLKNQGSPDAALIVKGMEGSTQIDFRKEPVIARVPDNESFTNAAKSVQIDYPKEEWEQCNSLAEYALATGIAALNGEKNNARQILINQVGQITSGLQMMEAPKARSKAEEMLDLGRALQHWKRGCN
ncbi:MAG TPA: hypothetical protein VE868_04920 [Balneolaceae bacterium]|nr:hypothetical protein [Balneolaceae bacterium]